MDILNIYKDVCWRCKNDYLVAYMDTGNMPYGPSGFTKRQTELARKHNVLIEEVFSKTIQDSYDTCVCPHCKSFLGDFFYHDFAYVPGHIQIELKDNDEVNDVKYNEDVKFKPHNGFDIDKENKRIKEEIELKKRDLKKFERNFTYHDNKCVRVKFKNGKNYPYNCPFDVKVGDIVFVEGKLQGVEGTVAKIEGKWKPYKSMQEVIYIKKIGVSK